MAATACSQARRYPHRGSGSGRSRSALWFLSLSATLPALLAGPSWAAKWDIVPTLFVEETYTDNVGLAPSGLKRSDWVTEVTPGVSVSATGARLRFNATYAAQGLYRAREESRELNHQLNASGNAELVRQLLFLDTRAAVAQQNISLLGPQAVSNVNTTGNRTTVRTFLVSPYLRHDFGPVAQGEARLTYSTVNTDATTSLSNSQANRIDMRLASGPAYKLTTWNLAYSRDHIDSTGPQDTTTEKITAGARRLITPTVGLLANVGYENNDFLTVGPAPKGVSWSAGLEWTPTPRTHLAATTGRRFFGATRSLDFSHRTRLTVWSVNYSEDITTTRSQLLVPVTVDTAGFLDTLFLSGIPDPAARQRAVQAFIAQTGLPPSLIVPLDFFTSQNFLVKRWAGSVGIQGVRNTVLANVFTETRVSEATGLALAGAGDFASSANVKQTGASLLWNWRFAARAASNLSVGYTRNEFPGIGREDNLKFIRLSLTRQFQPRLSGSLNYRRLQNDSDQSGAGHTENAVSAALNMSF